MTLDNIIANFDLLEDWEDRYHYVIELGDALPALPDEARTEANKVRGCASQVWLATYADGAAAGAAPRLSFKGDSDARIVRGLIAILFAIYSRKRADTIPDQRPRHLPPSRAGRASDATALERIRCDGRAYPRRSPPRRERSGGSGLSRWSPGLTRTRGANAMCRRLLQIDLAFDNVVARRVVTSDDCSRFTHPSRPNALVGRTCPRLLGDLQPAPHVPESL